MRILAVSHSAVVDIYREKYHWLANHGCEIHLALPPAWPEGGRWTAAPEKAQENGVFLHRLPVLRIGSVGGFFFRRLRSLVRTVRPDVLHMEEAPFSLACWQGFRNANHFGLPMVFFTWENVNRRYKPPLQWINRKVITHSAWAIAGSEEARQLLTRFGFQGDCRVIPQYGVNPDRFRPRPRTDRAFFTVGYAGRLLPEKGIRTLLRAAQRLTFPFQLILQGSGPDELEIKRMVRGLGLEPQTRIFPAVPHSRMPEILAGLDTLVLPSETRPDWKEQFGRVLIEAMACETPVVGSDSGEIPNVIGPAGIIFPEGDDRALAEVLDRIHRCPEQAGALGKAGRQRVLERYSTEKIAQDTLTFYRHITARQAGAGGEKR